MTIIDYTIVDNETRHATIKEVKELIVDGWQPHGNLIVTQDDLGHWSIMQAMVLFEEESAPILY